MNEFKVLIMNNDILNKRAIDATLSELADVVISKMGTMKTDDRQVEPLPAIIRGISGLASLLGCTTRTAKKYTADRRFESAVKKEGNLIIIETQKFLSIYGSKRGGRR